MQTPKCRALAHLIFTLCQWGLISGSHRLELIRPKDGGLVPPTFDLTFELFVEGDAKAFSRDHHDAVVCLSLDHSEPPSCFDILTTSLGVSDLPPGSHEMRMWVESRRRPLAAEAALADEEREAAAPAAVTAPVHVVVPVAASSFTVLPHKEWQEWLARGGDASPEDVAASKEEEETLVSPPLLEWWEAATRLEREDDVQRQQQQQQRRRRRQRQYAWVCPQGSRSSGSGGGSSSGVDLIIGIKTNAGGGFEARDALRRTWLDLTKPSTPEDDKEGRTPFCAWFLVGDPVVKEDVESSSSSSSSSALLHLETALQHEQEVWGDLLLRPQLMGCPDHYLGLVCKTKAFLKFATTATTHGVQDGGGGDGGSSSRSSGSESSGGGVGGGNFGWRWLMMLDDDVYVHPYDLVSALRLSAPTQKFYAGQVWAEHFGHPIKAMRNPTHQNHLPTTAYPMDTLPPFAIGPHYLMSFDCAQFIGSNFEHLQGVGTLEDVSVALWLLAIQVHPTHIGHFLNARTFGCPLDGANSSGDSGGGGGGPAIVSLADLTPAGLLRVHERVVVAMGGGEGRHMCDGFCDRWIKEPWRHDHKKKAKLKKQIKQRMAKDNKPVSENAALEKVKEQEEEEKEDSGAISEGDNDDDGNDDANDDNAEDCEPGLLCCLSGVCLDLQLPIMGSLHEDAGREGHGKDGGGGGAGVEIRVNISSTFSQSSFPSQCCHSSGVTDSRGECNKDDECDDKYDDLRRGKRRLELCLWVDDGERMCAGGLTPETGVAGLIIDGLKVGTHRVRAALISHYHLGDGDGDGGGNDGIDSDSGVGGDKGVVGSGERSAAADTKSSSRRTLEVVFDVVPSEASALADDEQQRSAQETFAAITSATTTTTSVSKESALDNNSNNNPPHPTTTSSSSSMQGFSLRGPTRVAILAINLLPNSQTTIFENIASHLPRPQFDVHIFATSANDDNDSTAEAADAINTDDSHDDQAKKARESVASAELATVNRLVNRLVPVHHIRLTQQQHQHQHKRPSESNKEEVELEDGMSSSSFLSIQALVAKLRATNSVDEILVNRRSNHQNVGVGSNDDKELWADVPHVLRQEVAWLILELKTFHVTTIANSMGVPATIFFAECARIAKSSSSKLSSLTSDDNGSSSTSSSISSSRSSSGSDSESHGDWPLLVLELPNLWPSASDLAHCVDALVAPSLSALTHPSVRHFSAAAKAAPSTASARMSSSAALNDSKFRLPFVERFIHPAALLPQHFPPPPPPPPPSPPPPPPRLDHGRCSPLFLLPPQQAAGELVHTEETVDKDKIKNEDNGEVEVVEVTALVVGRLDSERSPGLALHAAAALAHHLRTMTTTTTMTSKSTASPSSTSSSYSDSTNGLLASRSKQQQQQRVLIKLRVVVVGSGPLAKGLKRFALSHIVHAQNSSSSGSSSSPLPSSSSSPTSSGDDDSGGSSNKKGLDVGVEVFFLGNQPRPCVLALMRGDHGAEGKSCTRRSRSVKEEEGRHRHRCQPANQSSSSSPSSSSSSVVVVLNGRVEGETFGIANAEAVASGAAVVAFARGGNTESAIKRWRKRHQVNGQEEGGEGELFEGGGKGGGEREGGSGGGVLVAAPYTAQRLGSAAFKVVKKHLDKLYLHHHLDLNDSPQDRVGKEDDGDDGAESAVDLFGLARFVSKYSHMYSDLRQMMRQRQLLGPPPPSPLLSFRQKTGLYTSVHGRGSSGDGVSSGDDGGEDSSVHDDRGVVTTARLQVTFSSGASYLAPLLASLLPKAFPTHHLNLTFEADRHRRRRDDDGHSDGHSEDSKMTPTTPTTHMVVVSALDGGCGSGWSPHCQKELVAFVDRTCPKAKKGPARDAHKDDKANSNKERRRRSSSSSDPRTERQQQQPCLVMVVCGEPWDLSPLDRLFPRPLSLDTASHPSSYALSRGGGDGGRRSGYGSNGGDDAGDDDGDNGSGSQFFSVVVLHGSTAVSLQPTSWPSLHLPVAATSFGERAGSIDGTRLDRSPAALLKPILANFPTAHATTEAYSTPPHSHPPPPHPSFVDGLSEWSFRRPYFAAYLYFRCDRPLRERFVVFLQEAAMARSANNRERGQQQQQQKPIAGRTRREVHSLGACDGSTAPTSTAAPSTSSGHAPSAHSDQKRTDNDQQQQQQEAFVGSRFGSGWHDDAVDKYARFRFVVAFENGFEDDVWKENGVNAPHHHRTTTTTTSSSSSSSSDQDSSEPKQEQEQDYDEPLGYVTEKAVNAMLAGAIPVYWGPTDASAFFNPKAMVNCATFMQPHREQQPPLSPPPSPLTTSSQSSSKSSNTNKRSSSSKRTSMKDQVEEALQLCAEYVVALDEEIERLLLVGVSAASKANDEVDGTLPDGDSAPIATSSSVLSAAVEGLLTEPRVLLLDGRGGGAPPGRSVPAVMAWHPGVEPAHSQTAASLRLSFQL